MEYKGTDRNIGTINADVTFANSFFIEKKMQKVMDESGLGDSDIHYGVNWSYVENGKSIDLSTTLSLIGIISLILFSGYLIVSNIFHSNIGEI